MSGDGGTQCIQTHEVLTCKSASSFHSHLKPCINIAILCDVADLEAFVKAMQEGMKKKDKEEDKDKDKGEEKMEQ